MLAEFKRRIENISSTEFQKVICVKFIWRKKSNRKDIQIPASDNINVLDLFQGKNT